MGSSLSCLCDSKASKKHVFVITQQGKVLRVKAGTRVKDIVALNPFHIVIRGEPDHSVSALPSSFALGGRGLYFLVPEGQGLCRDNINKALVKLEQSRKSGIDKTKWIYQLRSESNNKNSGNQVMVFDASSEYKKLHWRPALHTIPESTSSLEISSN